MVEVHTGEPELLLKGYLNTVQNIKPKILVIENMLELSNRKRFPCLHSVI